MDQALETKLTRTLPELFARGVERFAAEAAAGDADAKVTLDDIRAARGGARLVIDGEGELFASVDAGVMSISTERPAGVPITMVFAFSGDVALAALAEIDRRKLLEHEQAPRSIARLASAKAQKAWEKERHAFHVVVRDTLDFEEVTVRVSLGSDVLPEKPTFTAVIQYPDLEALRDGRLKPAQFFMGGKMRLRGDASKFMTTLMGLLPKPSR